MNILINNTRDLLSNFTDAKLVNISDKVSFSDFPIPDVNITKILEEALPINFTLFNEMNFSTGDITSFTHSQMKYLLNNLSLSKFAPVLDGELPFELAGVTNDTIKAFINE